MSLLTRTLQLVRSTRTCSSMNPLPNEVLRIDKFIAAFGFVIDHRIIQSPLGCLAIEEGLASYSPLAVALLICPDWAVRISCARTMPETGAFILKSKQTL